MVESKTDSNKKDESPQQSLEKILQAEIETTEKISAANEQADKRIKAAQEDAASLKTKIIEQARKDREKLLAKGTAEVKKDAQKKIDQAKVESDEFEKTGKNFIGEAVQRIENIILGEFESDKE